jgi:hypothetical protein
LRRLRLRGGASDKVREGSPERRGSAASRAARLAAGLTREAYPRGACVAVQPSAALLASERGSEWHCARPSVSWARSSTNSALCGATCKRAAPGASRARAPTSNANSLSVRNHVWCTSSPATLRCWRLATTRLLTKKSTTAAPCAAKRRGAVRLTKTHADANTTLMTGLETIVKGPKQPRASRVRSSVTLPSKARTLASRPSERVTHVRDPVYSA